MNTNTKMRTTFKLDNETKKQLELYCIEHWLKRDAWLDEVMVNVPLGDLIAVDTVIRSTYTSFLLSRKTNAYLAQQANRYGITRDQLVQYLLWELMRRLPSHYMDWNL